MNQKYEAVQCKAARNIAAEESGQALYAVLDDAFTAEMMEAHERLCAQAGLEARHPMNHHRFVEFAFQTPERLRLQGDRTKLIHVSAMRDVMPKEVLERKDKAEFTQTFTRDIAQMTTHLVDIVGKRSNWVAASVLKPLADRAELRGITLYALCSLYGCDKLFQLAFRDTSAKKHH